MSNNTPDEFIKNYIDQLLTEANKIGPGKLADAVLLRADAIMDLVKAYRNRETKNAKD
jgi:hypothetical protein